MRENVLRKLFVQSNGGNDVIATIVSHHYINSHPVAMGTADPMKTWGLKSELPHGILWRSWSLYMEHISL